MTKYRRLTSFGASPPVGSGQHDAETSFEACEGGAPAGIERRARTGQYAYELNITVEGL
jgi:hypothetical protein